MSSAAELMQRATECVEASAMSDRTDAIVGQFALLVIQIAKTSPADQAESAGQIVKIMRG